jgi:hypothetical protein
MSNPVEKSGVEVVPGRRSEVAEQWRIDESVQHV